MRLQGDLQDDHGGAGLGEYRCDVCLGRYKSEAALAVHVDQLAIPDLDVQTYVCKV